MTASPKPRPRRGLALLLAHCSALDEARLPARERLDVALGQELAAELVLGLVPGRRRERSRAAA